MLYRRLLMFMLAAVLSTAAFAQDDTMLIMEDEPEVKVRIRPKQTPVPDVTPAPTPDPNDVIVGIVNLHVLTLADLESRVERRYEQIREGILETHGGVIGTFDPVGGFETDQQDDSTIEFKNEEQEMLEEQRVELEAALRREKGNELRAWVEHYMLADEARRQGIVVTQSEFQERLQKAEQENQLDARTLESALQIMQINRQDYERSVYDALMIERLLDRFISLNYTEAMFRSAYDKAPELFHRPEQYKIAHYTIVLQPDETRRGINVLKKKAEEVQELLEEGKSPEEVFTREEYDNIESGYFGSMPGWFELNSRALRPAVAAEIANMKVGETSDVITQMVRRGGEVQPLSFHVVQLVEIAPAVTTFEAARPIIHEKMLEIARTELVQRLYETRSHRIVTNSRGIPPDKIPPQEELLKQNARAEPINLRLPKGTS